MSKVYVTYDLAESRSATPENLYRAAHEILIDAERVVDWGVGEFKRAWGRDVYAVRISFVRERSRPESGPVPVEQELFEIPANAQNVRVHLGSVPKEYQEGLKSAA